MTREESVLKIVEEAHKSEFGLTAIKVEMEAGLGRGSTRAIERNRNGNCVACTRGQRNCECCEDSGRRGQHGCEWCEGTNNSCDECHGTGWYECEDCEGRGTFECNRCHGVYHSDVKHRDWNNNTVCLDFLMEYLAEFGLARKRRSTDNFNSDGYSHYGKWVPKKPLVFSYLYSDGGDTEWTFTILVKEAEKALLLTKCVDAFKALAEAVKADGGNETIDVTRAGMHMSLLNSPNGEYEWEPRDSDWQERFPNFRKSMILLLPAIYFLGASTSETRSLSPRTPSVSDTDKYSAVFYQGGALEFRVFDTCYENADQILDNLVVMCKSLRFWSTKYKRNNLDKVTKRYRFGNDTNRKLERLYMTIEHIELLNKGLKLLKPDYMTITDLKKQRNFKVDKRTFKSRLREVHVQAEIEYKEYERQFGWDMVMRENNYIDRELQTMHSMSDEECTPAKLRQIRKKAKELVKTNEAAKQTCEVFTQQKVDHHNKHSGQWVLEADAA